MNFSVENGKNRPVEVQDFRNLRKDHTTCNRLHWERNTGIFAYRFYPKISSDTELEGPELLARGGLCDDVIMEYWGDDLMSSKTNNFKLIFPAPSPVTRWKD
jgi:hypothetical protein